ncbi:MAG: AlkZ-related protein [Chthoniobacterales bacterium]
MPRKAPAVRTLRQARAFVLEAGICGIFSNGEGSMASLWDVVDLPGRKPGEKGWGQKVVAIWTWKNELPAVYPDEIFYGKIPGGLAVLMSMDYLRDTHYPKHHRPLRECGPLVQKIHALVRNDPLTTAQLRKELEMSRRPERSKFDRALQEAQTTLNIVRRNSPDDEMDTWVPFTEQYLEIATAIE